MSIQLAKGGGVKMLKFKGSEVVKTSGGGVFKVLGRLGVETSRG